MLKMIDAKMLPPHCLYARNLRLETAIFTKIQIPKPNHKGQNFIFMDQLFVKIVKGRYPLQVYDDLVYSFLDINPVSRAYGYSEEEVYKNRRNAY